MAAEAQIPPAQGPPELAECKDPSLVLNQTQRILESQGFRQSPRMARFLRHIVEAALGGDSGELKETFVGVAVYDRPSDYDPKLDPVVRNEARRLRLKLRHYYENEGQDAAVVIELPKGGYSPVFRLAQKLRQEDAQDRWLGSLDESVQPASAPSPTTEASAEASQTVLPPARSWSVTRGAVPPQWRLSWLLAIAGMLFCSAIFGALWWSTRQESPAISFLRVTPLTSFPGRAFQPSISPDGKKVAFVWDGASGSFGIYVMQVEGRPLRITPDGADYSRPTWSPDGQTLAYLRSRDSVTDVMAIDVPGGRERKLFSLRSPVENHWDSDPTHIVGDRGPAWTADGKAILVSELDADQHQLAIFEHDLQSGAIRQLTHPEGDASDYSPKVSADGSSVVFVRSISNSASDLFLTPRMGGATRRLTTEHADIRGVAWLGDSRRLLFSSNRSGFYTLWTYDLQHRSIGAVMTSGQSATEPSATPDGGRGVYTDSSIDANVRRIALGERPDSAAEVLFDSSRRNNSAQYSPDGRQIAFTSDRTGSWELWTANADGSGEEQITHFNGPMVGTVHWSPDNKSIVFDARPNGNSNIFIYSTEDGRIRPLSQNAFSEKQPFWSHDGKWIYFNSDRDARPALWKSSPTGTNARMICDEDVGDPQESSDGKEIYFTTGKKGLWRINSNGGIPLPVPGLEELQPHRLWQLRADVIYFIDPQNASREIQIYDLATGRTSVAAYLTVGAVGDTPSLSVSPDARWALISQEDQARSDIMLLETALHLH
jgi:Tol biopolymer transport system component